MSFPVTVARMRLNPAQPLGPVVVPGGEVYEVGSGVAVWFATPGGYPETSYRVLVTDAWGKTRWMLADWIGGQLRLSQPDLDNLAPGMYTLTLFRTADGAQSAMGSGPVGFKVERLLYLTHGLSGTVMATDRTGALVWRRAYLPFGEFAPLSGNAYFQVGAASAQEFGFIEKEKESETGLYRLGARWYNPAIGRFISPDPVDGVMNNFAYANNNPLRYMDVNGMEPNVWLGENPDEYRQIYQQMDEDFWEYMTEPMSDYHSGRMETVYKEARGAYDNGDYPKAAANMAFYLEIPQSCLDLSLIVIGVVIGGAGGGAAGGVADDAARGVSKIWKRIHSGPEVAEEIAEALDDVSRYRNTIGLPEGKGTVARMDIDGKTYYGSSGRKTSNPNGLNAIARDHAEIDVLSQAADEMVNARTANIYMDNPNGVCPACMCGSGIPKLANRIGLEELTVYSPNYIEQMILGPK